MPFVLIALSCHESLLKTAWNINHKLNINLKEENISIQSKDNSDILFATFCDHTSSDILFYNLISNKSSGAFLIKDLPNIDFILEIVGDTKKTVISNIIKEIKQVQGVIAVIEIAADKVKRKSAFIQP